MGSCLGREHKDVTTNGFPEHETMEENGGSLRRIIRSGSSSIMPETSVPGSLGENRQICDFIYPEIHGEVVKEVITRENIDKLVLKTLSVIRHLVEK